MKTITAAYTKFLTVPTLWVPEIVSWLVRRHVCIR